MADVQIKINSEPVNVVLNNEWELTKHQRHVSSWPQVSTKPPWWGPPSPTSPWRLGHDYDNLGGRPSGESRFRSKAEKFSLFLCWLFLIATYQQFCHWRCLWLRGWVGLWVDVVKLLTNFASFGQSILSHRRPWYLLKRRIAYLSGSSSLLICSRWPLRVSTT